ncbi:M50 family metallopeptidase [Lutibacter sp. B2]|nr:M50 family metallopeptidase [Lutibacter sp. B2]
MRGIRLCGMEIKINILLCIVFFICFILGYFNNILISFVVVILHEMMHTIVAKTLGYSIDNIEVFPFGGVARIKECISMNPTHEIMIALAGPIFNLVMAIISYNIFDLLSINNEMCIFFIYSNLGIGVFNLLPIIPLDGGRIIRAYFSYIIGLKKATKVVVIISKIMIAVLFLWGCYLIQYDKMNIFTLMLAVFLYIAADREYKMAPFIFMKEFTRKKQLLLCDEVLNAKNLVAIKNTSAKEVVNQFIPRKYHIVTVMDHNCNIIGLLTENDVLEGMMKYGLNVSLQKLLSSK